MIEEHIFHSFFSSSDVLAEERQLSQDLVQSSKKDQEFRSIFQHVQNANLQRSPSELFAQHIVTIVHHIKGELSLGLGDVDQICTWQCPLWDYAIYSDDVLGVCLGGTMWFPIQGVCSLRVCLRQEWLISTPL